MAYKALYGLLPVFPSDLISYHSRAVSVVGSFVACAPKHVLPRAFALFLLLAHFYSTYLHGLLLYFFKVSPEISPYLEGSSLCGMRCMFSDHDLAQLCFLLHAAFLRLLC